MAVRKLEIKVVRKLLEPQFGYWAKSTGELLYAHHFVVWSIFKKLSEYIPSLDETERYILEIACLIHDIGKMRQEIQIAFRKGEEPKHPHKITSTEEILAYLQKINLELQLDEMDIKKITDIIRTHHSVSEKDLAEIDTSSAGFYTWLLCTADYLASMDRISYETINKLKRIYENILDFTTVEYSRFPSPTTNLIVSKIVHYYEEKNWKPVCFPENGIIFIGKPFTKLPDKMEIIQQIVETLIYESLKMQPSLPKGYTGDHLTLLSRDFPELFLDVHRMEIKNALGNIDQKPLVFLKLLRDILSSKGLLTEDLKQKKPLLDMVDSANSTSAHRKVKERYKEVYKKQPPEKVNPEFFRPIFEEARLEDVEPESINFDFPKEKLLKELTPDELYCVLLKVAKSEGKTSSLKRKLELEEYLKGLISMEEEIDFRNIATEIFEKYKEYKKTSLAEKGCCEICGCPVAYRMQPALNLTKASEAFSQIKPKYAYRSICPFCGYDNLVLRGTTNSQKVSIFLRLQTKIPDLFVDYEELKRLVSVIWSGTRNPYEIIKFKERKELSNLPFPEHIEIPVSKNEKIEYKKILIAENGLLLHLEDIKATDFSIKDMKVKYEPLYHVMKLLGFKVAIGTEEQEGLFGEEVETNEENYYKSLTTILLAKINDKKQKKYIFSRSLLEKAPSVTIRIIGEKAAEKLLPAGFIKCLFKSMIKTKIVIARGGEKK